MGRSGSALLLLTTGTVASSEPVRNCATESVEHCISDSWNRITEAGEPAAY